MIDPENGAEQWNTLLVAGRRSPGTVRISGNDLKFGWDIKNADGQGGATTTRTNEPLKEFDAEFELSNELDEDGVNDMERWDEFQDLLEDSSFRKAPEALEIFHPDLARNHITAAVVSLISGMSLTTGGGGKIKVHFIEYRPPKPKKAAAPAKTKTEGDKTIDADVAEIDALQKEWKSL